MRGWYKKRNRRDIVELSEEGGAEMVIGMKKTGEEI